MNCSDVNTWWGLGAALDLKLWVCSLKNNEALRLYAPQWCYRCGRWWEKMKKLRFSQGEPGWITEEWVVQRHMLHRGKDREAGQRWLGHVQRKDSEGWWGWNCQEGDLEGDLETRYMGVVREDMKLVGVREEDAEDGRRWKRKRCFRSLPDPHFPKKSS